jgi:WD40 repeat protein
MLRKFRCFLDEREFAIGEPLSATTRRHMAASSAMVVIATKHAIDSPHVRSEVTGFLATGRPLVPISVGKALQEGVSAAPWAALRKLIWFDENGSTLLDGPSEESIEALANSFKVTKRQQQRTRIFLAAAVIFSLLAAIALVMAFVSYVQWQRAEQRALVMESRRLAAQARLAVEQQPVESLVFATESAETMRRAGKDILPETQEALYSVLSKVGGLPIGSFADRVTHVAVDPAGGWIAAGDNTGVVAVWAASSSSSVRISLRGAESVSGIAFLPSGAGLVAAFSDGRVLLWKAPFAEHSDPVKVFICERNDMAAMSISPSGRWLAVSTFSSGDLCVFDLEVTGTRVGPVKFKFEKGSGSTELAFSRNSRLLFATSYASERPLIVALDQRPAALKLRKMFADSQAPVSRTVDEGFYFISDGKVFDWSRLPADERVSNVPLPREMAASGPLAVSADGRRLAVAMGNRTVQLLKLDPSGKVLSSVNLSGLPTGNIGGLAFDPRSNRLIAAVGSALVTWSFDTAGNVETPRVAFGHEAAISGLAFLPDGSAVTGARDRTVRVWGTQEEPQRLSGHEELSSTFYPGYGLRWLKQGKVLATSSRLTKQIIFWAQSSDGLLRRSSILPATTHPMRSLLSDRSGNILIAKPWDDLVEAGKPQPALAWRLIDGLPSGNAIVIPAGSVPIKSVAISPDRKCLAVTIGDGVRLHSFGDGAASDTMSAMGQVEAVAFASDSVLIVGGLNELFVVKVADCKAVSRSTRPLGLVNRIAVSPDGSWGALASRKDLYLWRSRDGGPENLQRIGSHAEYISALAISPDGKTLVSAGADHLAHVWHVSVTTVGLGATLSGHAQTITSVALADDMALTTSTDRTARLWRLRPNGADQIFLENSAGYFFAAEFSPDGQRVAVAGYDGTVRIWNTRVQRLLDSAKMFAGRNLTRCEWSSLYDSLPYRRSFSDLPEPTQAGNSCLPTDR